MSLYYQLNQSISVLRVVGWYFSFLFNFKSILKANSGDPDQTLQNAAPDLGLHRLPMPHKKDAWLIWDNTDLESSVHFNFHKNLTHVPLKYEQVHALKIYFKFQKN